MERIPATASDGRHARKARPSCRSSWKPTIGPPLPTPLPGQYLTVRIPDAGEPAPLRSYSLSGDCAAGDIGSASNAKTMAGKPMAARNVRAGIRHRSRRTAR